MYRESHNKPKQRSHHLASTDSSWHPSGSACWLRMRNEASSSDTLGQVHAALNCRPPIPCRAQLEAPRGSISLVENSDRGVLGSSRRRRPRPRARRLRFSRFIPTELWGSDRSKREHPLIPTFPIPRDSHPGFPVGRLGRSTGRLSCMIAHTLKD